MSSPAPFLLAIGVAAVILLGSLMLIDAMWLASDPISVAGPTTTAAPPPSPPG